MTAAILGGKEEDKKDEKKEEHDAKEDLDAEEGHDEKGMQLLFGYLKPQHCVEYGSYAEEVQVGNATVRRSAYLSPTQSMILSFSTACINTTAS